MPSRWASLALLVLAATGCDALRGHRAPATLRPPAKLDPQLARVEPVAAPQPPAPPPLPTDPPVAPPESGRYGGPVPAMPVGRPAVTPPETPVVQTGAIALPEADGDERRPLRDRLGDRKPKPAEAKPPETPAAGPTPPVQTGTDDCLAVRKLLDASNKRCADLTGFEARLTKREVVSGKSLPQDEIVYKLRMSPLSVYMKVLSSEGQGREVMYVQGQFDNKLYVVTGKGDHILMGAGYKTDMDPDSKLATAKSRYRIYEAGFGRTLAGLTKALNPPDGGGPAVKALGLVQRKEVPYALDGVEVTIRAGEDPTLAKGGKRQVYFDPKPDSPGYLYPILVVTTDTDGKEVEYYFFDQLKVPCGLTDADWNPATLGKKK